MRISIIGFGQVGKTLARRFTKLGHRVSVAHSKGPESITDFANEMGATAVSVLEAAKVGEIVVISIPTKAVVDLPKGLFAEGASDVIVVDTSNYHPDLRDGHIKEIDRGMPESQWVARQIGRPVIKAFNMIFATSLSEKALPKGSRGRIALSVAGNSADSKALVFRLIDDLGFDPVDCGTLENSWRQQTGTPAYCKDLEATALQFALEAADYDRVAEYRSGEEARIKKEMAAKKTSGK